MEGLDIQGGNSMKIYIAGRISGYEHYKEHFARAEKELKEDGFIVLNPSVLPPGLTQEEYMRICIPMLNICDGIFMLKGWELSVGARIEHSLAVQAGKEMFYEID